MTEWDTFADQTLNSYRDFDHLLFSAFESLSCEDKEREQRAPAMVLDLNLKLTMKWQHYVVGQSNPSFDCIVPSAGWQEVRTQYLYWNWRLTMLLLQSFPGSDSSNYQP